MPITLGNTTIAGIAQGGLPNGVVLNATFSSGTIARDRLANSAVINYTATSRNSTQSLAGDSGWNTHISFTFSTSFAGRILLIATIPISFESGPVQGFARFVVNGSKVGSNWCAGRQTTANTCTAGSSTWFADVPAGTNTVTLQIRNVVGGSTWQTPSFSADETSMNVLAIGHYG